MRKILSANFPVNIYKHRKCKANCNMNKSCTLANTGKTSTKVDEFGQEQYLLLIEINMAFVLK